MQIDIAGAAEIISVVIAIAGSWIFVKVKLESHIAESDRQIASLVEKTEEHEKDAAIRREEIANRFGTYEAVVAKQASLTDELNKRLDRFEAKIDRLIERRNS